MKKNIGLLILGAISLNVQAGSTITWNRQGCESVGGVWVQANKATDTDKGCDADHCNEMTFCQSLTTMNWWSAFAWCESIGAQLADLNHACPNGLASNTCANLFGTEFSGNGWNTSIQGKEVNLIVDNANRIQRWWGSAPGDVRHKALCEQK